VPLAPRTTGGEGSGPIMVSARSEASIESTPPPLWNQAARWIDGEGTVTRPLAAQAASYPEDTAREE